MVQPSHFKKLEPRNTCADCISRKYNKETKQLWCMKHDFVIPREFKSKLKSLHQYTCDDVRIEIHEPEDPAFKKWWTEVTQVFKDEDCLYLLNTDEPDSYREYFEDDDSPRDVFYAEVDYSS